MASVITNGIDVSNWNGNIDFKAVKDAGKQFVIIKASQGHTLSGNAYLFRDSLFEAHIENAITAGMQIGCYHFFTGTDRQTSEQEADFFCDVMEPYKEHITLHAACDAENYNNEYLLGQSRQTLSENICYFCDRVKARSFLPSYYTNPDHLMYYLNPSSIPYPVWLASYSSGSKPSYEGVDLIAWQYSSTAKVPGISGNVDADFGYYPYPGYFREEVQRRLHLADETIAYMAAYRWNIDEELFKRIFYAMREDADSPAPAPETEADERAVVKERLHFADETMQYLDAYRFNRDGELWRRIYHAL